MIIELTVQVSIPVSLEYETEPHFKQLQSDALDNFLGHPALRNREDLRMFVDSIGNGEIDLTPQEI